MAVVLAGELVRGAFGAAAEVGHMILVPDGRPCGCGRWAAGSSTPAAEPWSPRPASGPPAEEAAAAGTRRRRPESITGPMVTMGAVAGDPVALAAFEAVGTWLGHGMADLAAILDPRVFIIGGGVSEAGELLVGPARTTFQAQLTGRGIGQRPWCGWPSWAGRRADRRRRPGPEITLTRRHVCEQGRSHNVTSTLAINRKERDRRSLPRATVMYAPGMRVEQRPDATLPTCSRAGSSPAVFDPTVTLDQVSDGYRAMADREALKVLIHP